ATQIDLEERLMFALDDRDTASRHLETTKEDLERTRGEAQALRTLVTAMQETMTRVSAAFTQLETLERDSAALRAEVRRDVGATLTSSQPPPPSAPVSVLPPTKTPSSLAPKKSSAPAP